MTGGRAPHRSIDLKVSVEAATGLAGAELAATMWLPATPAADPVVCVGLPGGGYGRRYFSFDVEAGDGGDEHGQAGYHADRGWVFVTLDHLGVGESTVPDVPVTLEIIAAAGHAAVTDIVRRLVDGSLADDVAALEDPTLLGLGQSMGGHFLLVQQAHHRTFHGIGVLGSSAIQTIVPTRPGTPPIAFPFVARSTAGSASPVILNPESLAGGISLGGGSGENPLQWAFHFDDEPPELVARDMDADPLPPWKSATVPSTAGLGVVPGVVASEAASVTVPVFLGTGERDVVPNPWLEPFAYRTSSDVTVYVCPRMAHMHNFATTRERLWQRLHSWGETIAAARGLAT